MRVYIDEPGAQKINSAVGAFAGAAASGMVAIDPDAAQAALTEIGNVKDELNLLVDEGSQNAHDVQIGANPVGEAMARKSAQRFSGGRDSLIAAITKLLAETEQAEYALKQAIANYKSTDYGNAAKYKG